MSDFMGIDKLLHAQESGTIMSDEDGYNINFYRSYGNSGVFFSLSRFATESQPYGPFVDYLCIPNDPKIIKANKAAELENENEKLRGKSNYPFGNSLSGAIKRGDVSKVRFLLDNNKELLSTNCSGPIKPLHLAAWHNKVEIIELLLSMRVPVEQLSEDYRTSIVLASLYCSCDAIKVLYKHGANVNHQDDDGDTALHNACFSLSGNFEDITDTIKLLLQLGADPTIKNIEGKNVLEEVLDPPKGVVSRPKDRQLAIAKILKDAMQKKSKVSKFSPK
jgi:ankyrin repeat protein